METKDAPPRFVNNGDGTVTDYATGLMWHVWDHKADQVQIIWQQAKEHCEKLTAGGYVDWRLPTVHELVSIVEYSQTSPAINHGAFPDTISGWYWTCNKCVIRDQACLVWEIDFTRGVISYGNGSKSFGFVRAVRTMSRQGQCLHTQVVWQSAPYDTKKGAYYKLFCVRCGKDTGMECYQPHNPGIPFTLVTLVKL